jgi:hypothetical protein
MRLVRSIIFVAIGAALVIFGIALERTGVTRMAAKTTYYLTKEPMFIAANSESKSYHLLPAGTPLYYDKSFAEGHQRYIIYANFKGDLQVEKVESDKPNLIDPVWLYQIERNDITKFMQEVPVSKDELVKILKARKITRDELAQIVRDWTD